MKKMLLAITAILSINSLGVQTASAASQDECSIWLCLPGGFPSGCGAAHSAMISRLKHFKPPLPPLASCVVQDEHTNPSDFSYTYKTMLKIAEHRVCVHWHAKTCTEYKTIPTHYRPGRSCVIKSGGKDGTEKRVPGCIGVVREIKVFEKGKLLGEVYYF